MLRKPAYLSPYSHVFFVCPFSINVGTKKTKGHFYQPPSPTYTPHMVTSELKPTGTRHIYRIVLLRKILHVPYKQTILSRFGFKDRQQSAQRDLHFWSYLGDYVMYINLLYVKK